jgi:surfeit locus 1 family protein
MYRFAREPRWIALHLVVLAAVVAMINLGLWQLRRLEDKRDRNALLEANFSRPPTELSELAAEVARDGVAPVRFRQVLLQGTWDPDGEVAIRNRTLGGAPGRWVATPLRPVGGGPAVLVVRGWIPQSLQDAEPPFEEVAPPAGLVEVRGYVEPTQERGSIGPVDRPEGRLAELSRVDVKRVAAQYGPLEPFFVQLIEPVPSSAIPTPVPLPEPDEGPHLAYAGQWAIFALIAIVGYPLVLRRVARSKAGLDD